MAPVPQKIKVQIGWVEEAVTWACKRVNHTINRDNMNDRNVSERLDDIIMGEVGSIAVLRSLTSSKVEALAYDEVRNDDFRESDPGWDIVVGNQLKDWFAEQTDPRRVPENSTTLSIKTSRIPVARVPDNKSEEEQVKSCVANFDFKVFKKSKNITDDIVADFEVQIYYSINSKYERAYVVAKEEIESLEIQSVVNKLKIEQRYSNLYITSFGEKSTLVGYNSGRAETKRIWNSLHEGRTKEMWTAPLWLGVNINSFAEKMRGKFNYPISN